MHDHVMHTQQLMIVQRMQLFAIMTLALAVDAHFAVNNISI